MEVTVKFYVQSVERQGYNSDGKRVTSAVKVNLAPVYAPQDTKCENAQFWSATPNGQLWMQINNPAAFDAFAEGQEFYLTFTPANE